MQRARLSGQLFMKKTSVHMCDNTQDWRNQCFATCVQVQLKRIIHRLYIKRQRRFALPVPFLEAN